MYFHTDDQGTLNWLSDVFTKAADNGHKVRILVDDSGSLKLKVAEGMWTPPIPSTPDMYRELSPRHCGHDECHQHQRCVYV